jgi:hypothetical protein
MKVYFRPILSPRRAISNNSSSNIDDNMRRSFFHVSTTPKLLQWRDLARHPLGGDIEDLLRVTAQMLFIYVVQYWLESGGCSSHGWLEFDPVIHWKKVRRLADRVVWW